MRHTCGALAIGLLVFCQATFDTQVGYGPPPKNARYCTSVDDTFRCHHNPNELREPLRYDAALLALSRFTVVAGPGEVVSTGIPQRIEGTDAEQADIRAVLQRMNDYFYHEVLSMPEYETVRTNCKNRNELCAFWAAIGECESNRVFMLPHCPAACRFCLLQNSNLGGPKETA